HAYRVVRKLDLDETGAAERGSLLDPDSIRFHDAACRKVHSERSGRRSGCWILCNPDGRIEEARVGCGLGTPRIEAERIAALGIDALENRKQRLGVWPNTVDRVAIADRDHEVGRTGRDHLAGRPIGHQLGFCQAEREGEVLDVIDARAERWW